MRRNVARYSPNKTKQIPVRLILGNFERYFSAHKQKCKHRPSANQERNENEGAARRQTHQSDRNVGACSTEQRAWGPSKNVWDKSKIDVLTLCRSTVHMQPKTTQWIGMGMLEEMRHGFLVTGVKH